MTSQAFKCKTIETQGERDAAFRLRHEVFIDELHRGRGQETDAYDADACHIVAVAIASPPLLGAGGIPSDGPEVVGTLRLYKLDRLIHEPAFSLKERHREVRIWSGRELSGLDPGDRDIKIGRVAVTANRRGEGIGTAMMHFAHAWASAQGYQGCTLHAQVGVRAFYERLGYIAEGDVFMEAGTAHIKMRRSCG